MMRLRRSLRLHTRLWWSLWFWRATEVLWWMMLLAQQVLVITVVRLLGVRALVLIASGWGRGWWWQLLLPRIGILWCRGNFRGQVRGWRRRKLRRFLLFPSKGTSWVVGGCLVGLGVWWIGLRGGWVVRLGCRWRAILRSGGKAILGRGWRAILGSGWLSMLWSKL